MIKPLDIKKTRITIIGLGYAGLPLSVEFGKKHSVVSFDVSEKRIAELKKGHDATLEVESDELLQAPYLSYTNNSGDLTDCNVYFVTVPTPIDKHKRPDLTPLIKISETIGKVLKSGDIVIYESTVYPGCTEKDCAPVLEKCSGLKYIHEANCNSTTDGFYLRYSPERINPGDKQHRVTTIKKVTAGSTPEIAEFIDNLYANIITVSTHKAASIKVAEAAKIIENTQLDVNTALINELAILFNKIGYRYLGGP